MPSLPKVARKLNLKIPTIHPHQPSYQTFLNNLAALAENKKYFKQQQLQKSDVDERYAQAIRRTFPKDPMAVGTLLEEAQSISGSKVWADVMKLSSSMAPPVVPAEVLQLNLPPIGAHHSKEKGKEQFDAQTYQAFAYTARKRNPDFDFTKERMDAALRFAASRFAGNKNGRTFDQMVARCLGKESTDYWKRS